MTKYDTAAIAEAKAMRAALVDEIGRETCNEDFVADAIAELDATIAEIEGACCRCGGSLGQPEVEIDPTADPRGWHDCYHCLNAGRCACTTADTEGAAR